MSSNWVSAALAVVSLALLYWQGRALISRRDYSSAFGKLTLFCAILATLLQVLLLSGVVIFASELHSLMAEGPAAHLSLAVFLLGVAIGASVGWCIALPHTEAKKLLCMLIMSMGLAAGAWALLHMRALNAADPKSSRICSFDLLWPGLLLWVALCLTGAFLSLLWPNRKILRLAVGSLVLFIVCQWALGIPIFYDSTSKSIWTGCSAFSLFSSQLLSGYWLISKVGPVRVALRRVGLAVVVAIGLTTAAITNVVIRRNISPTTLRHILEWLLVVLFVLLANRIPWARLRRFNWKTAQQAWHELGGRYLGPAREMLRVRKDRLRRDWVLWVVLITTFGGFFGVSYFASTDPRFRLTGLALGPGVDSSVGLSGLIFVWVLIIEIFGFGPLTGVANGKAERPQLAPVQEKWGQLRAIVSRAVTRITSRRLDTSTITSTQSQNRGPEAPPEAAGSVEGTPKTGAAKKPVMTWAWIGAVTKTLLGVVILIAVSEVPNAHKTLIQPFQAPKIQNHDENVGQEISDEVIDSLGDINHKLRPLVIGLSPKTPSGQTFRAAATGDSSTGTADALGKSNSLGLPGGVSLPLNLLLLPIQLPMRYLLGVRVINGSLHRMGKGYLLLAASSDGETWSVDSDQPLEDAVPDLAARLAFQIATRDPGFESLGMGTNVEGFKQFKIGLESWNKYESEQDLDALSASIEAFREATRKEPGFALAHYRLALAMQAYGNPAGAIEALRSSINADPRFAPGYVALASTLQDFDDFQWPSAAILPTHQSTGQERKAHDSEAHAIWQRIVNFPSDRITLSDSAAAYYGLCNKALDDRLTELAYFYCKRAEQFYARLPVAARDTPTNRNSEASVLNNLGMTLFRAKQTNTDTDDWQCEEDAVRAETIDDFGRAKRTVWKGPYTEEAMQYFELAEALQPEDRSIACNAATAAYSLGVEQPMKSLESTASARLFLGDAYSRLAREQGDNQFFSLALQEYEAAIQYNPQLIWALNNYGYDFWEFRLTAPDEKLPAWLGPEVASSAERYARRAGSLAKEQMTKGDRATVQSTLGEVLLAEARPTEAIQAIKDALQYAPKHSFYDELHWDLAQAYLCRSAQSKARGGKGDIEADQTAASELAEIRKSAIKGGDSHWLSDPSILDPEVPRPVCVQYSGEVESDTAYHFVLRDGKPIYTSTSPCNWEGIFGMVTGASDVPLVFQLRIWGKEVNTSVEIGATPVHLSLDFEPKDSEDLYFAQLWAMRTLANAQAYAPVSTIVPIRTYSSPAGKQCQQNAIWLNWVPSNR